MSSIHFDVWAADDLNGTALGELTQAYAKSFRRVDQAIGSGQFTINRHDSQWLAGWCAQDNLVRVRLVDGGPFDYDDERYVFAFFIESGDDAVLTEAEEGGDEMTRGGRDAVVILRRAVVDYRVEDTTPLHAKYWATALTEGVVTFLERNPGEVLRILLKNVEYRDPTILAPSSHDFSGDGNSTPGEDSAGDLWTDSDSTWRIPVGANHLEVLETLASGEMWWRMGTDLVLHAYDNDPGRDLSGSVTIEFAENIREAAERSIEARETISHALVKGTNKDGGFNFRWVEDGATETLLGGRREGFVEYEATPTATRLDKAGAREIRRRRLRWEGPTTMGVLDLPGREAFVDYLPGDRVSVSVPDIFDGETPKVYAIILNDREAGDYDVSIEFEEVPFDPVTGESLSTADCGKCPPLPPHQGGVQVGDPVRSPDDVLTGCNSMNPVPEASRSTTVYSTTFAIVPGETVTWRLSQQTTHEFAARTADFWIGNDADAFRYYHRCPVGCTDGLDFPQNNVCGGGDRAADSGQFVIPASGGGSGPGFLGFFASTDGYVGPPCHVPWENDCWTVELWHGAVDLEGTPDVPIPPRTGQWVFNEAPDVDINDLTTTLTLDYAYYGLSPRVRVDGVLISPAAYEETTPGSGVINLLWRIDADETVRVDYQAAT